MEMKQVLTNSNIWLGEHDRACQRELEKLSEKKDFKQLCQYNSYYGKLLPMNFSC